MKILTKLMILSLFVVMYTFAARGGNSTDSSYTVYPLQVGNLWQYYTYDYLNGRYTWIYGWTTRVAGDTVMPDGKTYAILQSDGGYGPNSIIRQEGAKVVSYYADDWGNKLWYDFSKSLFDTLYAYPRRIMRDSIICIVRSLSDETIFGVQKKTWEFYTFYSSSSSFASDFVSDGFGVTTIKGEAADEWFLEGAIINGVKYGTITAVKELDKPLSPVRFELYANYPNPFNPSTTLSFNLPMKAYASLKIFDVMGREVATVVSKTLSAGKYQQQWNASGMPSGVYFYRLQAGAYTETKRLVLVK